MARSGSKLRRGMEVPEDFRIGGWGLVQVQTSRWRVVRTGDKDLKGRWRSCHGRQPDGEEGHP